MSRFANSVLGITPVLTDDNFSLDAAIDEYAKIKRFETWGEVTTGAILQGRYGRSASGATPVSDTSLLLHPHSAASVLTFATGWTTQPTFTAGDAFQPFGYNANGGGLFLIYPDVDAPDVVGAENISCRNDVGTSQSSYGTMWSEA